MNSRWNDQEAAPFLNDDLAMRVYTSRLLGADENLVMHGGGNTSVKSTIKDFYDRDTEVLFVKGSGWDLKTIEKPGFSPLRLYETRMLADRATLSDDDMTKQLRANLLDPNAPAPSVEAILHAIMPFKFVDHTHTDAVVTLSNNPTGETIIKELYPDCLVLSYIMPGFILSKQVYDALRRSDIHQFKGIILLHHGVFTYANDAKVAYENMIELVSRAETYINQYGSTNLAQAASNPDLVQLSQIRRSACAVRGCAQLAVLNASPEAAGFASLSNVDQLATRGPITPDHVLRTKRTACIIEESAGMEVEEIKQFAKDYAEYFQKYGNPQLTMLDPAPRWAVWTNNGTIAFDRSIRNCQIIADLNRHTAAAIQIGESIGGWQALPAQDIFDLEYWVLEQMKLGKSGAPKIHQGKIAVVTGAASGIGQATAQQLQADGAVVVGLDVDPKIESMWDVPDLRGKQCDIRLEDEVRTSIEQVVRDFGGIDILVLNAGIFDTGETIDQLTSVWDQTIEINLTAAKTVLRSAIPFLKFGWDPAVVMVGSRNVLAPGAGAASYSVSKAGLTQLARVAALELAADQIRVNVVHPDAVFDTGIWTEDVLQRSAQRYGMTVDEYKSKNLLGREIQSQDVARLISTIAGPVFHATTGAQIPIDGGNERVI